MKLRTDTFDLWFFHRSGDEPRYLLLHASREKADRWFHGHRFWQTPSGGMVREGEALEGAMRRIANDLGVAMKGVWAAEHTYTFWNLKRANLEMIPVFACEVEEPVDPPLGQDFSEAGWFTAEECRQRLYFKGLKEGLACIREYVSEVDEPAGALRIL